MALLTQMVWGADSAKKFEDMFYVWITHSYEVIETDWVEEESLDDIKDSDDVNPNGAGLLDLAWVRGALYARSLK